MPPALVHWDEVAGGHATSAGAVAGLDAEWFDLGRAAGTVDVGLNRIRVRPGQCSTPPHVHPAEEEIFYVLAGAGTGWEDGRTYPVRAGDCLVHVAGGPPHTLRAGAEGLDVLAFGERRPAELAYLPRAAAGFLGTRWVAADAEHPWRSDAAQGALAFPPEGERPPNVVAAADVERVARRGATVRRTRRDLGGAAGSRRTGLKVLEIEPDSLGAPPHCHSAEEEVFVVLEGEGTLLLGDAEHAVRAGHVVARPAGTGVAHAFRAGPRGLVLLAYGQRVPDDACFYPRSGKIAFRGLGVVGRIEPLDLWDGED